MTRTYLGYTVELTRDTDGWEATVKWPELGLQAEYHARAKTRFGAYGKACLAIEDFVARQARLNREAT